MSNAPHNGISSEAHAMNAQHGAQDAHELQKVWDLPLRLFHWLLAAAIALLIASGEAGGPWMDVHARAGLLCAGLLGFRVAWGLVGSSHARFARFAPTPASVRAYLRGAWHGAGHNPLGALSVLALLAVVGAQVMTGLFAQDDIAFAGPWNSVVDDALADRLTALHALLAKVLFVLLALHLGAVAFYTWVRKQPLVRAMVTGWKPVDPRNPAPRTPGWAAVAFALAMAGASALTAGGSWWPPAAQASLGHDSAPRQSEPLPRGRATPARTTPAW